MVFSLFKRRAEAPPSRPRAPAIVEADDGQSFDIAAVMTRHEGFPIPEWEPVYAWIEALPKEAQGPAWGQCERAWMLHMRDALGPEFRLDESDDAMLVSTLEPWLARQTLEFMARTRRRIIGVLEGVARFEGWGKDLLVVFDDLDGYYRYASHYYPDAGDFSISSGMRITRGCSHFITRKDDLRGMEPVVAHEMTHEAVGHLPLPLWLNEGLAVNTEHRLTGNPGGLFTPREMHEKHLKFWGDAEIQKFWSGDSWDLPGDANMLSYDLARILVEQLAAQWAPFAAFVNSATHEDAGAAAAREHLGVDLGDLVAALLDRGDGHTYTPGRQ